MPLLLTGTVVLVTLALTQSFELLPGAVAAYAAAWWALGLRRHGEPTREE